MFPYTDPCIETNKSEISKEIFNTHLLDILKFTPRTRDTSFETVFINCLPSTCGAKDNVTSMRFWAVLTAISLLILSIRAFFVSADVAVG
jgi:hypothetical protein